MTQVPIVTTHGIRRYTRVSMAVGGPEVLHPAHPEAVSVVMNIPSSVSTSTAGVCHVALDDIDNLLISDYELERDGKGDFKHIRFVAELNIYEALYHNAEQRRSVCLGRFIHAATASLAHAIARSNEADPRFRCVPYSVQMYIESIIRVRDKPMVAQAVASQQPTPSDANFDITLDDLLPDLVSDELTGTPDN